jgi:hypothetical protein
MSLRRPRRALGPCRPLTTSGRPCGPGTGPQGRPEVVKGRQGPRARRGRRSDIAAQHQRRRHLPLLIRLVRSGTALALDVGRLRLVGFADILLLALYPRSQQVAAYQHRARERSRYAQAESEAGGRGGGPLSRSMLVGCDLLASRISSCSRLSGAGRFSAMTFS